MNSDYGEVMSEKVKPTPFLNNTLRLFIILFMAIACYFMVMFMVNMGNDMRKMTTSVVRMSDDVHTMTNAMTGKAKEMTTMASSMVEGQEKMGNDFSGVAKNMNTMTASM